MEINTTATTLNLTNSILDDEVYRILGESLKKIQHLKHLQFVVIKFRIKISFYLIYLVH